MSARNRPDRKKKADRLTSPHSSGVEIECDYALGPVDQAHRDMDRKWGVDRLPDLVTPDMAAKFGKAMSALNASIDAVDPAATRQNASNVVRGLAAMDAAAEASGASKSSPEVFEYSVNGIAFAVLRDGADWPALKAARPDLLFYTMREVANAMAAYQLTGEVVSEVKKHFPGAEITKVTNTRNPINWDLGGDKIPF